MTENANLLEVRNVARAYGSLQALDHVSLDIKPNEFFALLGPSGCGKTTLLRIIAGFETPDSGDVDLEGKDLLTLPPHKRPLNMMFQSYALFPHMTVEKNVGYGLRYDGVSKAEAAKRVADALEVVGLGNKAKSRPTKLSGGQRQRVALARAIIKQPKVLLLDEPLSALDKKVRAEMQLELKRLQHEVGITFVIVTHDQEEALSLADRIAVMNAGRIEQIEAPQAMYENPSSLFVADFIGSNNVFPGTGEATGVGVPELGLIQAPIAADLVGAPAALTIRPEHIRVQASAEPIPDGWVSLPAQLIDVEFMGSSFSLTAQVAGGQLVRSVQLQQSQLERDTAVNICWDPEKSQVFADPNPR